MGEVVSIDIDTDIGAVESRTLSIAATPAYRGDTDQAVADIRASLAGGDGSSS
jgi:hypothetical protein